MAGFKNLRSLGLSFAEGKHWISSFRKAATASATVQGQWFDYSYVGGNPIANYYAAAPLEAAVLEPEKGIIVPRMLPGEKQFLHRITAMSLASGNTSTTNQNQPMYLLDYLMFYPFVDMDAAGEDQVMIQSTTLPRYTDGVGVQMMCVAQSTTVGGGRFTITYTGSDDVQYTTISMFCGAAQPPGTVVNAVLGTGGLTPFVPLNAGVRGVKRVDSVNFSVANGGLIAVVLVMPLETFWIEEECRRTSTGTLESFGAPTEKEALRLRAGMVEIKDGAFLSFLGQGNAGTLASSVLSGVLETVWR